MLPHNLRKARVTVDELLALLRLGGCPRLSDAWSAMLEPTGKLGIIKKSTASPITRKQMGLNSVPVGPSSLLVREGKVNAEGLKQLHQSEQWLRNELRRQYGITDLTQVLVAIGEAEGTLGVVLQRQEMN